MASALLGALAPAAISALTSGGGSSSGGGGNILGGLVQEGVKKSGGIISGIGGFVSDLLHGKGFKESLAGGIDTMIGRTPQQSAAPQVTGVGSADFQARVAKMGIFQDANGNSVGKASAAANGLAGLGIKISGTHVATDPSGGSTYYVTAVIPMLAFAQMVNLYMAQKGFSREQIDFVRKEIDAYTSDGPGKQTPNPLGPMSAEQNRAVGAANTTQYGFPILAPAGVSTRSADVLFPKYVPNPQVSQQSPPAVTPPAQIPKGMPAGGIGTSGGAIAGLPVK